MNPAAQAVKWYGAVKNALKGYPSTLDAILIVAIIYQESGGNPWAYNPEPRYRWFWNVKIDAPFRAASPSEIASKTPPNDFPCLAGDSDQEWWGQQASWGLMQLMGAAAREQRFRGGYLTELCDPYVNIEFGVKHWWTFALQYGNRSKEEALSRWNTGNSEDGRGYASEVLEKAAIVKASL